MAAPQRSPRSYAVAGLVCGALFFALGWLTAQFLAPASAPHLVIADTVVALTPTWLVELAIDVFGSADKVVLRLVVGLVAACLAAGVGLLARRSVRGAQLVVALIGVLCMVLALTRPDSGRTWLVPSAIATVGGLVALGLLGSAGGARPAAEPQARAGRPVPARRTFLRTVTGVGIAAVLATAGGAAVAGLRRSAEAVRDRIRLPAPAKPAPPVPPSAQVHLERMPRFTTPNRQFYRVDTALLPPQVDPDSWRLRIHGLTDREIELSYQDLLAEDLVEIHLTLTCVSNRVGGELAGNATWLGFPVRHLLQRAGVRPEADMVLSRSTDGFTAGTPLEALTDDRNSLLAVGMNDAPLPVAHGFPVRMVVPGLYGYVSATKWLTELEVTRFDRAKAYWTRRGWSPRGPIKTASRIDVPRDGDHLGPGPVTVAGTAWAQHRGVERLQVRVDDGSWQEAELATEVSIDTWRQWSLELTDLDAGEHVITCRAWDPSGPQTATVAPPVPDGASGYHSISISTGA